MIIFKKVCGRKIRLRVKETDTNFSFQLDLPFAPPAELRLLAVDDGIHNEFHSVKIRREHFDKV